MKDKKRKISVLSLQSTGSHTKQGWLKKQGGRHKNWKTRLFILAENILYYFKTEKDKEPKGLIPLSADCKIEFIDETETSKKGNANTAPEKWSFKIRTPWRVYWLCNENIQEISSWVSVLNMATKITVTSKRKNVIKEGWIAKQGNTYKSWKMRYMVLESSTLYYYERPDSDVAIGSIALLNAIITHNDPTKVIKSPKIGQISIEESNAYYQATSPSAIRKLEKDVKEIENSPVLEHGFRLTNDIRSYLLYALRQRECDQWTLALQKAILNVMSNLATSRVVGDVQVEQPLRHKELVIVDDNEVISQDSLSFSQTPLIENKESLNLSSEASRITSVENTYIPLVNSATFSPNEQTEETSNIISKSSSRKNSTKLEEFSYLVSHFILHEILTRNNDEKELKEYLKEQKNKPNLEKPTEIRKRSGSLFNQAAINVLRDQSIDPNMIPIRLKLQRGIYYEESIKLSRPIEIEGSGIDNTIIVLYSSTRINSLPLFNINSHNVHLKNLTLKIFANDLEDEIINTSAFNMVQANKTSLHESFKSVVYVSSGSCLIEKCKLICEFKNGSDRDYVPYQKTCGVFVTNSGRCYLQDSEIQCDYGLVATQMGFICSEGGVVKAKLNPIKKFATKPGGDARMYDTKIAA